MEFRTLGPVQVWREGSPISLGGPRHRRLLAVLLVHAGAVVPGDELIDALWPSGAPRRARDVLHVRVSELRAALRAGGDERDAGLAHREGGYRLRVKADQLDAQVFERLASAGGRALADGDVERARGLLGRRWPCTGDRRWPSSPTRRSPGRPPRGSTRCGCGRWSTGWPPISTPGGTTWCCRNWRRSPRGIRCGNGSGHS